MGIESNPNIRRGKITPMHGVIIALSLIMTVGAWQFSKDQIETRIKTRFEAARDQAIGLLQVRMNKYEDALWSGVSALESHGGDISFQDWRVFATSLNVGEKYPGINGVGVIHFLGEAELPAYLARMRADRPNFRIHPEHSEDIYMPISFIEPENLNAAAVGLDVAHELNRRTAALASRDSGKAQITGPIVLVQDAGHTPGFLFYAPFGEGKGTTGAAKGASGAVYAPFIVQTLMQGLLAKDLRTIRFNISDGTQEIYDEHSVDDPANDPDPMFSETVSLNLYGRTWVLDVRTNLGFRAQNSYSQPTLILIGGLVIEVLIIAMLVLMSRANTDAIKHANRVTADLRKKTVILEETNDGLNLAHFELEKKNQRLREQNIQIEADHHNLRMAWSESEALRTEQSEFTYAVSHDLKSPANTIQLVLRELSLEQLGKLDNDSQELLDAARSTAERMSELIEDILSYAWATNDNSQSEEVDMKACVDGVVSDMTADIETSGAMIEIGQLDPVYGSKTQVRMLIQNLIGNAIKFQNAGTVPRVSIECRAMSEAGRTADGAVLCVRDNGIGVASENHERIFGLFQRLHVRETYPGTGLGLATCQRIAKNHNGSISVDSELGKGSMFRVLLREPSMRMSLPDFEDAA